MRRKGAKPHHFATIRHHWATACSFLRRAGNTFLEAEFRDAGNARLDGVMESTTGSFHRQITDTKQVIDDRWMLYWRKAATHYLTQVEEF